MNIQETLKKLLNGDAKDGWARWKLDLLESKLGMGYSPTVSTFLRGNQDQFTVSATPETTYQLTFIPISGTCAMYVNGLEQEEGTDYTVDYNTASGTAGLVTFVTGLTTGDRINFRYLVANWLPDAATPTFVNYATVIGDNSYGTSITGTLPSGLAAGDRMLMGVGCELHTPNTPTGWTLLTTGTHLYVFSKTATVGETAPTVTFASNPGDRIVTIRAYRGPAGTPIVAASASNDVTASTCTAGQPTHTGAAQCVYFWSDFTPFVGLAITLPAGLSNGTTILGAFEAEASGDELLTLSGTAPARTATGGTSNSEWTGATVVLT